MGAPGKRIVVAGIGGFLAGAAAVAVLTVVGMRSLMIVRHESTLGFDETVAALEERVKASGWTVAGVRDMNRSLSKHGVAFGPRVTLVEVCKADYAARVLADSRHVATLMPCALAVYEGDDGRVYVARMNTGLMGKVFGGTVAEVMGGDVSRDEAQMLDGVVR